ncbi:ACP S-malonyltransferase [Ectothiorhodospira lacustris]|uniref:ACP S-malonyltransferase n=1 Tax=Ectothiorhodospira lacustris TaxID=2899127 RepID=UPI001EE8C700|nr:ACP S-malonyltransferase [Ectothiorhodospira lacustris]MCG5500511.1 ACP S-malonyltransferase [Ectothiorhodospira lacustris]MCG5510175.1 ACP S-malonyltransferase [Ectothiorhodospira lacustris]MCG5522018.1 ACP S-malonyltransferase [Ectothiorhodospira lacustris]
MKLACVFPGQGSQSLGMLGALAEAFPLVRETFQEASDVLGLDLWALTQTGPADDLNRTENTQPAMLAAGVAVWRVWTAQGGIEPEVMAGHSLGEYTALVCADALDFDAAVRLVAERGRLMQSAVPAGEGAMAAILGLDDEQIRTVCREAADAGVVEAVNYNAPGQVVIAGQTAAVDRAIILASEAGAKRSVKLPVSVPSHCSLLKAAASNMHVRLESVRVGTPAIRVIHNVDVASHAEPDVIRAALAAQIHRPVRWVETVQAMAADGVTTVLELGPGKVLTGLNKRIDKALTVACVQDPDSLTQALALGAS